MPNKKKMLSEGHLLLLMLKAMHPIKLLFLSKFICHVIIWLILKQHLTNMPKLICAYLFPDSELTELHRRMQNYAQNVNLKLS